MSHEHIVLLRHVKSVCSHGAARVSDIYNTLVSIVKLLNLRGAQRGDAQTTRWTSAGLASVVAVPSLYCHQARKAGPLQCPTELLRFCSSPL